MTSCTRHLPGKKIIQISLLIAATGGNYMQCCQTASNNAQVSTTKQQAGITDSIDFMQQLLFRVLENEHYHVITRDLKENTSLLSITSTIKRLSGILQLQFLEHKEISSPNQLSGPTAQWLLVYRARDIENSAVWIIVSYLFMNCLFASLTNLNGHSSVYFFFLFQDWLPSRATVLTHTTASPRAWSVALVSFEACLHSVLRSRSPHKSA